MASLDDLIEIGTGYLSSGVVVEVKTNYGPAIPIYTGSSGDAGAPAGGGNPLWRLIGLKAGVVVRDRRNGNVLASYGGQPATDPVRVSIAASLLAVGVLVAVRAIVKRRGRR